MPTSRICIIALIVSFCVLNQAVADESRDRRGNRPVSQGRAVPMEARSKKAWEQAEQKLQEALSIVRAMRTPRLIAAALNDLGML